VSEYGRNINTARCPDCPPSVQTDACYCNYAGAHIVARIAELEGYLRTIRGKLEQMRRAKELAVDQVGYMAELARRKAHKALDEILERRKVDHPAFLAAHDAEVRSQALADYLSRQIEFSTRAFGSGRRTGGNTRHIEKELAEIRTNPTDLTEWIDVATLAFDGYWRHGGKPQNLLADMEKKLAQNIAREWPAPASEDEPVEHIKLEVLHEPY